MLRRPLGGLTAGHLASGTLEGSCPHATATFGPETTRVIVSFHAFWLGGQESFHRVMMCVIPLNFLRNGERIGLCLMADRRPSGSDCPATIASNSYSIESPALMRLNQRV